MGRGVEILLSLGLGGFFAWSGFAKIFDLAAFTQSVANYQIIGRPWDGVAAYLLPWVEIFAGLAVMTGLLARGGLLLISGMLLVFMVALSSAWARGLNIACGCYGESQELVNYPLKLSTNMVLLLVAIGLLIFAKGLRRGSSGSL